MNEAIASEELGKAPARRYTAEEIRAAQNGTARELVNFLIYNKRRGEGRGWAQVKGTVGGVEGE